MLLFCKCLARAIVRNGPKELIEEIPFGGLLFEVARDTWDDYRERLKEHGNKAPDQAMRKEVEALAQEPAETLRKTIIEAVKETAGNQSPQLQQALSRYLTQ